MPTKPLKINNFFLTRLIFSLKKKSGFLNSERQTMRLSFLGIISFLLLTACGDSTAAENKEKGLCEGRQWENSKERLDCLYPNPPIGRWKAVYTEEFAKAYNLPLENISIDLSPGVDYMEMDVQPYGNGGTACLVNMLVKNPHDIALFNLGQQSLIELPEDRKLVHLIELNQNKKKLKAITTFNSASRDYNQSTKGYRASTFAMYTKNVLPGYDYISANAYCRDVSMHPQYFPDGYALWVARASVWGAHETPYESYNNSKTPKGRDFFNSHLFINIPHELVSSIFENVPIGGR